MYELAGYPDLAARQLIRGDRAAVRSAALDVAEHHLAAAHALTGRLPDAALEVLIERIDTLTLAGRAADGYHSGIAALHNLRGGRASAPTGGCHSAGRLQRRPARRGLATFGATRACSRTDRCRRRCAPSPCRAGGPEEKPFSWANSQRRGRGRPLRARVRSLDGCWDCRAGRDVDLAARILQQALALSEAHQLSIWQVQALAELGDLDLATDSDPTRGHQARELATAAGMLGTVALLDAGIGHGTAFREGHLAAYPIYLRADAQAGQLQLTGLYAVTHAALAACVLFTDDRPLPGRTRPPAPSEFDDLIAEALGAGKKSGRVPWVLSLYGVRAWLHGDNSTAIRLIDEGMRNVQDESHVIPWWGVGALLRVVAGTEPEETSCTDRTPRQQGGARLRHGRLGGPKRAISVKSIAEADHLVRIRRSPATCCVRPSRRLSIKPAWSPQPRAGCERPTHSAVRPANVPCNVWSATRSPRSAPKSRRVQHQLSHHTWPDSGSPHARQTFCGLSTPA